MKVLYPPELLGPAMSKKVSKKRFPMLETERLVLREVTLKDAQWYYRHFNTREIVEGQEHKGPGSMKVARREVKMYFVDNFKKDTGIRWGLTYKGDGELIGSAGLYLWKKDTRQAETGYDLNPKYWDRGIMTEAMIAIIGYGFDKMNLNRIEALIAPYNTHSIRLVKRLGFMKEGVLRDHYVYKGRLEDDLLFSLLRREWKH